MKLKEEDKRNIQLVAISTAIGVPIYIAVLEYLQIYITLVSATGYDVERLVAPLLLVLIIIATVPSLGRGVERLLNYYWRKKK